MKLAGFRSALRATQLRSASRHLTTVAVAASLTFVLSGESLAIWYGLSAVTLVLDDYLIAHVLAHRSVGFRRAAIRYLVFLAMMSVIYTGVAFPLWLSDAPGSRACALLLPIGGMLHNGQFMIRSRAMMLLAFFIVAFMVIAPPLLAFIVNGDVVGFVVFWASCACAIYTWLMIRDAQRAATQMRHALAQARNARVEAERANAAKSEFLATISHEIRTPLNAVAATAHLLKEGALDAAQRRHVGVLNAASDSLTALLNDVLDLARIEAGKINILPEPVAITERLEEMADLWRPKAQEKRLVFTLTLDPNLPQTIEADLIRLRQIVFNLLSNAVKFTESGGVTLRVDAMGQRLRIEVQDSGIGMDEEGLSRVFGSFEQTAAGAARGGAGLGLAISRKLAELMGGELTADSTPGVGSVFRLCLPLIALEGAAAPKGASGKADLAGLRLLAADDNAMNRMVLDALLSPTGCLLTQVTDGDEAVDKAAGAAFDAILLDGRMPRMSGIEAAQRIRAGDGPNARTPIIAITANAFDSYRAEWLEAGAEGFIGKPIDPKRLAAQIEALIRARA